MDWDQGSEMIIFESIFTTSEARSISLMQFELKIEPL
jgi:hypothetical protein